VLDEGAVAEPGPAATDGATLDVVTYNLHSGLGARPALFRRRATVERNLRAIAGSIAGAANDGTAPDVVALNEVDFGSRRSAWIDQARFVADELERLTGRRYRAVRGETWRRDLPGMEVRFGNAVLVALPMLESSACLFDALDGCAVAGTSTIEVPRRSRGLLGSLLREPRGVIRVTVEHHGALVDVVATHLDAFDAGQRETQAALLLGRLLVPDRTTVLLGDMNAVPGALTRGRWMFSSDRTHAILATGTLADASLVLASNRRQKSLAAWATFPAAAPAWGLDWVLGSLDLAPNVVAAIGDSSSDHRGLYVRYRRLRDGAEIAAARALHGRLCERLRAYDSTCGAG
jgi:endonuclease/exonuclease/phosphatase family metal-dependent hydrolase